MMDYDKYYKSNAEGYHLHFYNKQRLTSLDIKEKFSSFGNVKSVNLTNNGNGLVFVVYKTLEETEKCIEGLQDSDIRLLPERSKLNNTSKDLCKTDFSQKQKIEKGYTPYKTNENNGSTDFPNTSDTYHQDSIHKSYSNMKKDNEFNSERSYRKLEKRQTSTQSNSSDTIDYEKYYKMLKDETYCVHFFNKTGLSLVEIEKIFLSFGNVLSTCNRPEINKYVFVRYKTLEEIMACIKGLQNHDIIHLLPEKNRVVTEMKSDQRSSSHLQTAKTEDTKRLFGQRRQLNCENNDSDENLDSSDSVSHDSKQDYGFVKPKYMSTNLRMPMEKNLKQQNFINSDNYGQETRIKNQTKPYSSMETEINNEMSRNIQTTWNHNVPELISDVEMKSNDSDTMSDNSLSNLTKRASKVAFIIPMEEIIVANIPKKCSVHYILHLFEKYDPISATIVKTISESNIRYCRIYFKTAQDAKSVEEEFDYFDLFGQNLIVLRKSQLVDKIN